MWIIADMRPFPSNIIPNSVSNFLGAEAKFELASFILDKTDFFPFSSQCFRKTQGPDVQVFQLISLEALAKQNKRLVSQAFRPQAKMLVCLLAFGQVTHYTACFCKSRQYNRFAQIMNDESTLNSRIVSAFFMNLVTACLLPEVVQQPFSFATTSTACSVRCSFIFSA